MRYFERPATYLAGDRSKKIRVSSASRQKDRLRYGGRLLFVEVGPRLWSTGQPPALILKAAPNKG
jgi:hypothetical protein